MLRESDLSWHLYFSLYHSPELLNAAPGAFIEFLIAEGVGDYLVRPHVFLFRGDAFHRLDIAALLKTLLRRKFVQLAHDAGVDCKGWGQNRQGGKHGREDKWEKRSHGFSQILSFLLSTHGDSRGLVCRILPKCDRKLTKMCPPLQRPVEI